MKLHHNSLQYSIQLNQFTLSGISTIVRSQLETSTLKFYHSNLLYGALTSAFLAFRKRNLCQSSVRLQAEALSIKLYQSSLLYSTLSWRIFIKLEMSLIFNFCQNCLDLSDYYLRHHKVDSWVFAGYSNKAHLRSKGASRQMLNVPQKVKKIGTIKLEMSLFSISVSMFWILLKAS